MNGVNRQGEIAQLGQVYGLPARRRCVLHINQANYAWWNKTKRKRDGEVVLFVRRKDGSFLLHTKDYYPQQALRVPSGGIKPGEALIDAVRRESFEETGLQVAVERFLAVVEFEFHFAGMTLPFPSYLFLLSEVGGELQVMDTGERISAFAEVPVAELASVAEQLENVPTQWQDWGRFRAYPHRLAAELLQDLP
ncbi:MAG: NUDIX hydrolase [Chloroflexi bacterium]|nr:NUDIX hydrolase [Chloroflexota bacterium]